MPALNHERDRNTNTTVMIYSGQITDVMKTIADRLKEVRKERGPSQEALAKAAGVSQGTIGNIESGERRNPRELLAIARALGVNPEWLKSGRGPRDVDLYKSPEAKAGKSVLERDFARPQWPFSKISLARWNGLDLRARHGAEALVLTYLEGLGPDSLSQRVEQQ